jgi:hypothetical protein
MASSRVFVAVTLVVGLSIACGTGEPAGDLRATESHLELGDVLLSGDIGRGETRSLPYESPPKHRAYAFEAGPGERITVDVQSSDGDAMAWLTTPTYAVLSDSDDAGGESTDARIVYRVPTDAPSRSYRVVFREYRLRAATFHVTLAVRPPVTCSYYGKLYAEGARFASIDGCNDCSCAEGGVACTGRTCPCNPDKEPHRNYVGTPQQCETMRYDCPSATFSFLNDCGCGCERYP